VGSLKASPVRITAGERDGILRRVLVTVQVAIALTLLIGAGLMARSYWSLHQVQLGFSPSGIVTFRLPVPASKYGNYHAMARVHREVLRAPFKTGA
jgi:hypothetical protein